MFNLAYAFKMRIRMKCKFTASYWNKANTI